VALASEGYQCVERIDTSVGLGVERKATKRRGRKSRGGGGQEEQMDCEWDIYDKQWKRTLSYWIRFARRICSMTSMSLRTFSVEGDDVL